MVMKVPRKNPYSVFVQATYHQIDGDCPAEKIKRLGALWRTLDPQTKAEWAVHAQAPGVARNICVVNPPERPNATNIYMKEKMAEAPAGSSNERMRHVAEQWNALKIEDKAIWSKRATELQELNLQRARRAPRLRSGYNIFVRDRFHLLGGKLSHIVAAWRAAAPKVREFYIRRAAELNASVASRPQGRRHCSPRLPTALHEFVKAKIVEAPEGSPTERIRHVGLQWSALSTDEKAVWARKAAELRQTNVP